MSNSYFSIELRIVSGCFSVSSVFKGGHYFPELTFRPGSEINELKKKLTTTPLHHHYSIIIFLVIRETPGVFDAGFRLVERHCRVRGGYLNLHVVGAASTYFTCSMDKRHRT